MKRISIQEGEDPQLKKVTKIEGIRDKKTRKTVKDALKIALGCAVVCRKDTILVQKLRVSTKIVDAITSLDIPVGRMDFNPAS